MGVDYLLSQSKNDIFNFFSINRENKVTGRKTAAVLNPQLKQPKASIRGKPEQDRKDGA